MNIAIIGRGNVGTALKAGFDREGHSVCCVGRDPAAVQEAGAFADIVILALPYAEIDTALAHLGETIDGKILVDATNVLTPDYQLATGFTTSGGEELQKKAPTAKVVKAFNTAFAATMETGHAKGQQISALVAGDDAGAKKIVLELAASLGFDPVDAGPLENARLLEPFALLTIRLGVAQGHGPHIGFHLIH